MACTKVTHGTTVTQDGVSHIVESPASLAAQAGVSLDVYSLGRCIASEGHSGPSSEDEKAAIAIGQVVANGARKRGVSVTNLLIRSNYASANGHYGEQLGRYAATSKDPCAWHLSIAADVLAGRTVDLISGATKWNDPRSQDSGSQAGHAIKDAITIIQKWTSEGSAWIGGIPGLSSYSLMFYRDEKDAAKRAEAQKAAIEVVQRGRLGLSTAMLAASSGIGFLALLALGTYLIAKRE